MLEKNPHKSSWKTRKRPVEEDVRITTKQREKNLEVRETLEKVKKYAMILCAFLGISAILSLFVGIVYMLTPILMIVAVFIGVFFIYFPVSDRLKEPEAS